MAIDQKVIPAEEQEILTLKRRAIISITALTSGTFLLQFITILSQFIISVLLEPSVFGIFAILSAGVSILTYFSDIGLAAALIQKKESLTKDDLKTTFTLQQLLVLTLVIGGLLLSESFATFYKLNSDGLWLLRALIFSFLLASLKTIPTILLERNIQFTKLTIVSITEALVFYFSIISLAMLGYGLNSFTYAVLLRGISGLVLMYILSPWKPMIGINREVAKKLLSFGVLIQANSIIALIKDNLFILYLGKALTHTQLGYFGWAKSWSEAPLRLVMDAVSKVMFPLYSRLQHNMQALREVVEKTLFFQSSLIFPLGVILSFIIHPSISLIPRYAKWEPAIPLFYLFIVTSLIASIVIPLTHVLNATGRVTKTLYLMVFWTILTWGITPIAITQFGFVGAAIAALTVGISSLVTILIVKKIIDFSLIKSLGSPLLASGVLVVSLVFTTPYLSKGWVEIIANVVIGGCIYSSVLIALEYKNVKEDIRFLKGVIISKK